MIFDRVKPLMQSSRLLEKKSLQAFAGWRGN